MVFDLTRKCTILPLGTVFRDGLMQSNALKISISVNVYHTSYQTVSFESHWEQLSGTPNFPLSLSVNLFRQLFEKLKIDYWMQIRREFKRLILRSFRMKYMQQRQMAFQRQQFRKYFIINNRSGSFFFHLLWA